MFQMLQTVGQFSGMPTEDPHLHLHSFLEVSDSFKIQGVSKEVLRLKLFPFSLRDRARSWLNTLPPDSVTNWNDLAEKFLRKYFPPTRNAKFRTRMVLDASANSAILSKSYNEAFEILETIASKNYQWSNKRAPSSRKVAGVLEVDAITALTTQMASMTNVLKNLSIGNSKNIQPAVASQSDDVSCVFCGEGHVFEKCPSNPESEQAPAPAQGRQEYPPGFSQQSRHSQHAQNSQPSFSESLMRDYMAKNDAVIQSQACSLRNLELQLGHLANELKARPQGSLPSNTENPRRDGKEQCKSIQLRSGKHLKKF
ncbi:uncharacterized protein LOC133039082 [Cannabis sativa]|uniref:uncharacterized protein LOC133039082 n=1 Tax=Cannabis sativa TaxID=3483 RepID=UPI0029CA5074|nr:uncharacterized protein LOC133039082 [Cannabis sativa]